MGISSLLGFVAGAKRRVHLADFRGKRVAVDAYVWLHRGAIRCPTELVVGVPTDLHTEYAMHMIRLFRANGVEPMLVFDGSYFPCKAPTEESRAKSRAGHRRNVEYLRGAGKSADEIAKAAYKAIDITPEIARVLQLRLREVGVDYCVAPFEADVQLAYLCLCGLVDACCTEDSDILVYQAPRVLYKLDHHTGEADLFEFDALEQLKTPGGHLLFSPWSLWRDELFTTMCVMAGCDYLPSAKDIGIQTAYGICASSRSAQEALCVLRMRGHLGVAAKADEYLECFHTAELIFSYAPVYDPLTGRLRRLCNRRLAEGERELALRLAKDVPVPTWSAAVVHGVCCTGDINPITLQLFEAPALVAEAAAAHAPAAQDGELPRALLQPQMVASHTEASAADLARSRRLNSSAAACAPFKQPVQALARQFDAD
jgi:exonuclease-1